MFDFHELMQRAVYDTRSTAPLTAFSRLDTEIEDLAFVSREERVGLTIATSDGNYHISPVWCPMDQL